MAEKTGKNPASRIGRIREWFVRQPAKDGTNSIATGASAGAWTGGTPFGLWLLANQHTTAAVIVATIVGLAQAMKELAGHCQQDQRREEDRRARSKDRAELRKWFEASQRRLARAMARMTIRQQNQTQNRRKKPPDKPTGRILWHYFWLGRPAWSATLTLVGIAWGAASGEWILLHGGLVTAAVLGVPTGLIA